MDDYRKVGALSRECGSRSLKQECRASSRAALKRATAQEPTEPEVCPAEISYFEHLARCRELGIECTFCGEEPCACVVIQE